MHVNTWMNAVLYLKFLLIPKQEAPPSLTLLLNRECWFWYSIYDWFTRVRMAFLSKLMFTLTTWLEIMTKVKGFYLSFAPALVEVMKWRDVRNQELADATNLGVKAISNLRNGKTEPKLESIICRICVGMKVPSSLSHLLIGLTENNLITGNRKHNALLFLLTR